MKGVVVAVRKALVRVSFGLARRLPLRSRIVLATSHADEIGGNLACIREEVERRSPPIRLVVLAHRSSATVRGRIEALWYALRAGYHLATARLFVVDDYFFPMYVIRPRQGTTFVQVWHASGAFKKFGYSVLDKSFGADEQLIRRVPIHANYDLCLISSMAVAPHYAEAFGQPLDRFVSRLGMPRTDLFFDDAEIARRSQAVRYRYAVPSGKRVILYAPTFRGDSVTDARFAEVLDIDVLHSALGEDHVLLMRLHPFVRHRLRIPPRLAGFALDASDLPDIHELMLVSDLLVTDYSSAIYEYALLSRPILFFAPDHAAYERERGFYFEYRSGVPGPVFETTQELAAFIRAGRFDTARVAAFGRASFDVADGHASERFVDQIVLPALAGRPVAVSGPGTPPAAL